MHEFGLCEAIVQAVEKRAEGRPVAAIGVRAGALHRIVPDSFEHAFEMVSAGGVADGADAELVVMPVTGECKDCGEAYEADDPLPVCSACGSARVERTGGDELYLEWVRYREPVEADAGSGSSRPDDEGGA